MPQDVADTSAGRGNGSMSIETSASRRKIGLLAVMLVALAVRLFALWHWGNYDLRDSIDQGEYVTLAQNLRLHGAFSYGQPHKWGSRVALDAPGPYEPTAARAPFYPFLVAALWWQDAPPLIEVRLVQVALGAAVAVLVYLIAFEAFGFSAALIAGLAMALAPFTASLTATLLTETLFSFLLTTSLWLWMRRRGVFAGIALGAATLTRAVVLPLIGVVLLLALVAKVNRPLHLKIALAALVVVLPWTARNVVTQHAFIPVNSMGFGANMLLGMVDVPYGSGNEFLTFIKDKGFMDIISSAPTAEEAERRMLKLAGERIGAAPLRWFWVRVKQYPRFWISTGSFVSQHPVVRCTFIVGSVAFWGIALAGMALARRRWRELYPIAFFPIMLAGTHFIGTNDDRYSLGLVPMAAIFAGFALSRLITRAAPA